MIIKFVKYVLRNKQPSNAERQNIGTIYTFGTFYAYCTEYIYIYKNESARED